MPIAATLLFGSLARDDHSKGSDTDLLLVSLEGETNHVSVGHLSLFTYPWAQLKRDARHGDLFVCHLVKEARPLVDPDGYLRQLKKAFRFRTDYRSEIGLATDFGWYLTRFGNELNSLLQTKRALWCVRTILIARSAERHDPIFAPERLAEQTKSAAGRKLLMDRHRIKSSADVRRSLRDFLKDEAPPNPFQERAGKDEFIARFEATSNKVALQTLRQNEKDEANYL